MQIIAFTVIGLILIVTAIPNIFANIYNFTDIARKTQMESQTIKDKTEITINIVKTILGIWLLFGSASIVNFLKRLRDAGAYHNEINDDSMS